MASQQTEISMLAPKPLPPTQVGQAARALVQYVTEREGEESLKPLLDSMPGFQELVR